MTARARAFPRHAFTPSLIGLAAVAVLVAATTIASELDKGFKAWIAFPGHHWVGKGILAVVVFVIVFAAVYIAARKNPGTNDGWRLSTLALTFVAGSALAILAFYVLHFALG